MTSYVIDDQFVAVLKFATARLAFSVTRGGERRTIPGEINYAGERVSVSYCTRVSSERQSAVETEIYA